MIDGRVHAQLVVDSFVCRWLSGVDPVVSTETGSFDLTHGYGAGRVSAEGSIVPGIAAQRGLM
jgi:hypothetical protein